MKKILLSLILFWLWISFTSAIDLSSSFLEVGKELSVYGKWFGSSIGKYGWICFDDDKHCFVQGSPWLSLWSDTLIKVFVPSNISLKWKIKVYVNSNLAWTADYSIKPVIIDISDWIYVKESAWASEKILIQWKGFGDLLGNVYFGEYKATIVSWTENKIWLNVPNPKQISPNLKVKNSAWIFSDVFTFKVYPKISNDEYSARQKYLSVLWIQDVWKNYKKLWDWVTVAIMDVGVKFNHPDLISNVWTNPWEVAGNKIDDDKNWYVDDIYWRNFVSNSNDMSVKSDHGTMIAWIIAAKKDNGIWIAGIAPNAKIMTLKVFDNTLKTVYNIQESIKYAVDNGAKIINVSFWTDDLWRYEKDFDTFFQYAYDHGVVLTVAAGNTFDYAKQDLDKYMASPICNDGKNNFVLWVSAVNNQKIKSDFARYGSKCIDIVAPWEDIFSSSDKKFNSWTIDYTSSQWTSFATPIVAWAVALLWSNNPSLKNTDIYNVLKKTWDDIDGLNPKYKWKLWKYLNIKKLMERGVGTGKQSSENILWWSGIDKKALTMFINIQAQIKNYSETKQQESYKAIYTKLEGTTKDWSPIKYIEDLKKLVKGQIK